MSVSKNKVLPVLRFGDFSGNWDDIRFGDISTVIRGASPRPKGDPRYYGSGIPRLMVEDVARDGKFVDPVTDSLTKQGAQLSRYCKKGTLTIVCSGTAKTVGQASFLNSDACIHDGFLAMLDINADFLPDFIYYQVQKFQAQAERMATHGGTFINLTTSILKDFKRAFPTLSEQKKISEFLTSVDERIGQLIKKKALLEDYKKGVMQQLFSQQIRFKDDNGNDFPDWEEKKLGDFDQLIHGDGNWILSENITPDGEHKIVQLANIGLGNYIKKNLKTISNNTFKKLNGTPIKLGDLLINRMVDGNVNSCIFMKNGSYVTSVDVCWIRKNRYFDNYFLMSLLLVSKNQKKLLSLSSGSGRVRISKKNLFEKFPFELPCMEEQKKIADFLSAIDQKIESVSQQIAKTQTFKKGLLQQMFV